jgi:outer membrane protein assembly factor BamA
VLRLDAPDLADGRMRLDGRGSFQRTINEGYYGIGNGSSAVLPVGVTSIGRTFQYLQEEGRARFIVRVHTHTAWDLVLGANLRYEAPSTYAGSRLAFDDGRKLADGSPFVRGVDPAALGGLAAGVFYDTRDSEFITTRGAFYQLGVGGTVGSTDGIGYGNASAVLANYAPIGGPVVFASRFVASFAFGNVPFYDLQQGGTFEPQYLFGGETGVRGVPNGRYAGKVMVVTNLEIRVPLPRFRLIGQRFRLGVVGFLDAGRVWADYDYDPTLDGTKLDLKYGIGGGAFLQWGEAAIFRVEAAYSPDAVSENPSFPVGLYVSDGLMF